MELFKPGNTTYFDVRPKPNVKLKPSDDSLYLNLSMEWTYTFEHPYDEQGRWKLIEGDSIVLVESPFHLQKQAFVIDHIQKGLYSMTVTCHHYFVESAYTQILDRRAVDATPQRAMDILFEGSEFSGKAEAGFNTQNSIYYSQDNILNFVKGENKDNTLSQRWGGEFFYDNRVLKWYEVLNKDKVFKIIFSHNLTELGLEEDWKGVYTRVYPKAYNGRMLSEPHYINSERVGNYRKVKSTWVNFDDIGLKQDYEHYNEENPPDNMTLYDTQQQLEAAIHRKVKKLFDGGLDLPTITGTVNAALLHNSLNRNGTIELPGLGYTVKAYNKLTNMEYQSRIIAVDWNTVKKRFNSIELGDSGSNQNYFDKISSTVDKVVEEINQSNKVDWNQVIKDTSEKLTEYINNGTYYGHVKITKNELLILDNPDLDRARKVWRWNMGGLGFSTSGYGGPYETAITADGKMVINEATAQTIKATMIRAGVLASMDNSSWFNLDDGTFSWANGAITFDKENGLRISIDGKPLDELLKNNLTVSANKEHQIIVLDEDGTPSYGGTYPFEFSVYTMGTTSKVHSVIKSATASDSNVVATFEPNSNIVKITVDTNRVFTAKEGYVDVVVETMYHDVEKRITWSAVTDGVDASYVKILSTGQVFSMAASESSYSPSSISLTPNMTNCSFSSWQYSVDGSIWNPVVSGQHGLTIGGDKKLTVANTCDLFTDTLTTINFRVNCTENASDTTSLTRIRDGVQGSDAVIVQLDNENHTFLGDKSGKAVPITLTINILGYSGLIKKPTTVGSITGAPTGMTVTAANNNTTNNRITIQVTSAMVSTSGVVTIPITCMGLTFNKTFSYTLSLPGSDGSAARLATIQPEQGLVFKCASDSSTFNPNVLVLTPIFSNTSFSKWQYRDSEGIWKDLTPETGEDTEWPSCGNHIYQNKNTKQLRVFSYTPLLNNDNALSIKLISNTNESDVVTLVKIKDGNTGPQGPAGSNGQTGPAGSNAINIIVSGEQVFKYSNNFTSGPTPTSIKLTATKINTTAQGKWEYLNESGAWTQISADSGTSNTSTVSISPTTGILSTAKSMRVRYIVGSIYDEMTIIKVSDGSNGTNGSDGKPGAPGAQGPAGTNGKDSYTVILTNESHTFVGDVSNALAGDTSSLVLAYKGNTKMPTTIGSITGMPTGMSVQVTNNNSTNAGFTVTVTTSLTTKTGVLKVPITVDGISFVKEFSYSISFKGNPGSSAPNIIVNGEQVFKYTNNYSGSPTPANIVLTATKINLSSEGKWQYKNTSGSWEDILSGSSPVTATTLTVTPSTGLLASAKSTNIRYAVGSVYDEITIVKVTDGAQGQTGPQGPQGETGATGPQGATPNENLVLNSAFLLGATNWSLSTNVTIDNNKKLDGNPSCKSSQSGLTTNNWRGCINYNLPNKPTTFKKGEKITASMYYFVEDKSTFDNNLTLEVKGKKVGSSTEGGMFSYEVTPSSIVEGKWTRVSTTVVLSEDFNEVCIRAYVKKNGTAWFTNFKLERGDLTLWLPNVKELKGDSSTTVQLSNENHTFVATSNGAAVTASTNVSVYGFTGATAKNCTIGNITGNPAGMSVSIKNNGTTNASVEISVSTSMTTKSGIVTIPITCDGITINKMFTFALAVPGANGQNGASASYVDAVPTTQFFKCPANSNTYSPESITITPTFVNCTYTSWQYSTDGGLTQNNVVSGQNGLTISGNKLIISNTSPLFTSSITAIAFKVNASGGRYDIVTISKLKDGDKGATGPQGGVGPQGPAGSNGSNGADAYTVLLTNESHTFLGDVSAAVTGSTSCEVIAYKGATKIAATIGNISGMPTGMTTSISNNGTTNASFTVNVNSSMVTKAGSLTIPITVDGKSFTKNFSFSLSLKGQTGEQGPAGQNGKGISKIENFYLVSSASSGITTSTGGWSTAIPTLTSTNKYLWNYEKITYTDNSTTSTNPVVIGVYGDKGQAGANGSNGADGNGIKSITEYYLVSSSGSGVTTNTPGWSTTVPAMTPTKKYLWNYEVIAYTSSGNTTSTPKVIGVYGDTGQTGPQGPQGNAGKGVSKIENFYLVSTSSTGVTTQTGGWSTSIPTLTSTNRFLWNYEKITYTTGDVTITTPVVIGVYGDKGNTGATGPAGATGNGIKSITEYYLATSSSSGVTTSTSGWTTAIQSMTTTNRYLWNYEVIAYTNGTSTTTTPKIIGVYGNTGPQGPQGEEGATPNFNLVQNSGFLQGLRNWILSTNVTIDNNKKLDGNPSCKSSQSGLTTNNWRGCINYNLPNKPTTFKKGEKITASMYYFVEDKSTFDNNLTLEVKGKKVGSSTEGGMFSYEVTPSSIVEGKWTRVSTTVVLSEDFNEVCIRAYVKKNGTAWFTNFKLERGDLTLWLPNVDEMQGINIILTNESHTLAAQSNGQAVPTTVSTGIVGYIGATQTPCTIGNISGLPNGMTASIANNDTKNATVNFSITSSLTTKQGTVTIPVTCGGVTINKIFSYSLALDGTPASNVKIGTPSNTFLSNDGGNTYTPTTITLTGSFVQCSYSKWQYTTGTSFSDVVSGANGFTINGDKSLTIAVTSPLFGSKAGSITIKLLSNVGTAYDIITINKLVQVANISEELKDIKSQITTSNNKWEAAFSTGNANNLLYDGDFKIDVKHWVDNGGSLGVSNSNHFPFFDGNKCLYTTFKSTEGSGVRYAYDLELRPGTDYVFEAWVYVSGNVKAHDVLRFWSWKGSSPSDQNLCQKKEYQQAVTPGRYSKCWVHFKTPDSATEVIKWRGFVYAQSNTGSTVTVNVRQVSLREASMPGAWQPNSNEIVAGITTINQEGIKVEHTNVGTYTTMTADGFSIRDSATGDVLAWLSNKSQWTELKVDKVFANNLENIYEGLDTLYVNHASSSAGTGSSSSPFNSFASLQDYLSRTPVINKDLNIIVRDPKVEINEQFYLHDLKGTGIINITLEGNLVIRSGGNGVPAVRFAQVDKWIKFVSGRQFGSATTGAVICDNPNNGGGGHGIFATDVRKLEVDAMTIACKNWGIVCERTDLYTWHIDFGKCYTAVELRFMSMYYSSDDVGSNANFCLIKSGSKAFWGYDGGTPHRPQGTVNASNGIYYSHSNCTPTPSTRYGGGNPVPPSSAQVYTQTFGWTSHKTYQYQWGNWGDSDCKQGSWGYGLRGGHMFFDIGAIRNFLGNTIEEGNTITLTRANKGGISGGAKVYINGSNCSSPSGTPSYGGQTYLGTLAWGETKTFTLPKALVQGLKSGSYNSLAVYVNSSASDCYLNIVNCSITLKTKK